MDFKLKNKTALVTGGGHGLGKAVCSVLAEEGASLIINYNRSSTKAVSPTSFLTETSTELWNETFQINMTGTFLTCK